MKTTSAKKWNIPTLALLAIFAAPAAMADTNTSSATISQKAPSLIDNLVLSYYGVYNGPALTNPGQDTPAIKTGPNGNAVTDNSTAQYMDSLVAAGYKVTPDVIVGAAQEFYLSPVPMNQYDYSLLDPLIYAKVPKLIHGYGFNMMAQAQAYIPTSSNSQAIQQILRLRSYQISTYDVPNSRLQVAAYTSIEGSYFNQYLASQQGSQPIYGFKLCPFFTYQLTPKFSATLWNDLIQLSHKAGTPGVHNAYVDVEPGVNWDITPKISVNPFINIFPANPTGQDIALQFILAAKIL